MFSPTNKKAHRSSPGPMCFYSTTSEISMTEKALIAKLIKNQNRKQTIRHSNSGLVMASVFVILAFSAFAFFKADADQTQKHQEHVLVQVEGVK